MSARIFSASADPRVETEFHPAWCRCGTCASPWDAAHCGLRQLSVSTWSLLIAAGAFTGIILFVGVV